MSDANGPFPADARRHRRAVFAFAVLCWVLILAGYFRVWTWGLTDSWTYPPEFADTAAILAAGEAQEAGLNVYEKNPYDPYRRPHVYGPGWLITGKMGLTVADSRWVGWLFVAAFVTAAALLLSPRDGREVAISLALVCSPPVILGLGRGNNDLVVFVLLAACVALLLQRRPVLVAAAHGAVAIAALLKLYPAIATAVLLLERDARPRGTQAGKWAAWLPRRHLLLGFLATVAGCLLYVALSWSHYRHLFGVIPNPPTVFAYGFPVAWTMGEVMHFRPSLIAGWALGLTFAACLTLPYRRVLWRERPADVLACHALVAGGLAWGFCYATIASFPYRLVLVLLCVRYWLALRRGPHTRGLGTTQLILWGTVAWAGVPMGAWSERALAAHDPTASAWVVFNLIAGFEEGLLAGGTLALVATAVAILVASLRGRLFQAPAAAAVPPAGQPADDP